LLSLKTYLPERSFRKPARCFVLGIFHRHLGGATNTEFFPPPDPFNLSASPSQTLSLFMNLSGSPLSYTEAGCLKQPEQWFLLIFKNPPGSSVLIRDPLSRWLLATWLLAIVLWDTENEGLSCLMLAFHAGEVTVPSNPHIELRVCVRCTFCPTTRFTILSWRLPGLPWCGGFSFHCPTGILELELQTVS
jgi:hypothetical protein